MRAKLFSHQMEAIVYIITTPGGEYNIFEAFLFSLAPLSSQVVNMYG